MATASRRPVREVRHEDEDASWRFLRAGAAPGLARHVLGYTDYAERASGPVRRRELPETGAALIFNLGPPLSIADPREPARPREFGSAFLAGLTDTYTLTETPGAQAGVQVHLTPLGARRLFGVPMHELANRVVPLEDVVGADARRLVERLAESPPGEARWRLVDRALSGWASRGPETGRGVQWAVHALESTHGAVAIGRLTETLGWSRKRLVAAFREEVGVAPKLLARVLRFRRAVELLREPAHPAWSRIAYACGYADQSHMTRDFRQFAGMPPGEFHRRRLPAEGGLADG